jgi:hypothetical protein
LNCGLRNGDAHLKNFAIVYDDVLGEARLAPVYDLVTTAVYLPYDSIALTMNGTNKWPSSKELRKLGETAWAVRQLRLGRFSNASMMPWPEPRLKYVPTSRNILNSKRLASGCSRNGGAAQSPRSAS